MTSADDFRFMARALALARRGLYGTDPNPRVGCVIVNAGRVVGEGWHARAGEPHAEANALAAAGAAARGATVYVTLEPCRHQGRTGPCTRLLTEAGVARVVAAVVDADPRTAGRGLAELAEAGIAVESGVLHAPAAALNVGFLSRHRRGRPFVRLKLAASLDGRTALASGESKWITGPAARRDVQRLRARSSAVLTGIGTLLADDPALTVRSAELLDGAGEAPPPRQPLRVVLDSRLRTPGAARMLGEPGKTLIATAGGGEERDARELAHRGAEVVRLGGADGRVDLSALMAELARREVNEVLAECGPTLAGALLEAALVDELVVYVAPALLGDGARGMFHLPQLERMAERRPLRLLDVRAVGPDLRIVAAPAGPREP